MTDRKVLYLIVCAAGAAEAVDVLVKMALADGWDVWIAPTPSADPFLDIPALETLTGHPVRSRYRLPGEDGKYAPADAVIVAPATYNTINKWAAGISDTFALGLLAELTGPGNVPIVVLPFVNASLAANRVFGRSVQELRDAGVTVLLGEGGFVPHPAGTGGPRIPTFPWQAALDAVRRLLDAAMN